MTRPDSKAAPSLEIDIRAGELVIVGDAGDSEFDPRHVYSFHGSSVELGDDMAPKVHHTSDRIVIRQTHEQWVNAKAKQVTLRIYITGTARWPLVIARVLHGTVHATHLDAVNITMMSGTAHINDCRGAVAATIQNGTIEAAHLARGRDHALQLSMGTIALHAGVHLASVEAHVHQGVITGRYLGMLEPVGMTGMHLHPAHAHSDTRIACEVGSGSILVSGRTPVLGVSSVAGGSATFGFHEEQSIGKPITARANSCPRNTNQVICKAIARSRSTTCRSKNKSACAKRQSSI